MRAASSRPMARIRMPRHDSRLLPRGQGEAFSPGTPSELVALPAIWGPPHERLLARRRGRDVGVIVRIVLRIVERVLDIVSLALVGPLRRRLVALPIVPLPIVPLPIVPLVVPLLIV